MVGIGIIGTGKQGADHARRIAALGDKARLVTVHDLNDDAARAVADECGAQVAGSDQSLIEDPAVDAVIIASITGTHVPLVLACIEARKPVLTEKPLGIDRLQLRTRPRRRDRRWPPLRHRGLHAPFRS